MCKAGKREGRGAGRLCGSSALGLSTPSPHHQQDDAGKWVGGVETERKHGGGRWKLRKAMWDLWKQSRSGFDM